MTNLNLIRH